MGNSQTKWNRWQFLLRLCTPYLHHGKGHPNIANRFISKDAISLDIEYDWMYSPLTFCFSVTLWYLPNNFSFKQSLQVLLAHFCLDSFLFLYNMIINLSNEWMKRSQFSLKVHQQSWKYLMKHLLALPYLYCSVGWNLSQVHYLLGYLPHLSKSWHQWYHWITASISYITRKSIEGNYMGDMYLEVIQVYSHSKLLPITPLVWSSFACYKMHAWQLVWP